MNRVRGIRRYPLKSAAAEHIATAVVGKHGLDGDRTWVCLDADGTIGSAKQPRLWGGLLDVAADYRPGPEPRVILTVPGHAPAEAGSPEAEAAISAWLGRPIRLTRTASQPRRHHWWPDEPGMIPEWAADAEPGGDAVVNAHHDPAGGRFFDFGPLHLVTTGALAELNTEHGGDVDPIRFRPNLILDLPADPEPGRQVAIGADLVVQAVVPTPRCVIPSIAHGAVPADRALLKTLAAHHRIEVPDFGKATCFGWYAEVVHPGEVAEDDEVRVLG